MPDPLANVLGGETEIERLWSWLEQKSDHAATTSAHTDRIADLEVLAEHQRSDRPLVVESEALPLLLSPANSALIVRLFARLPVRIARLRGIVPELTTFQARTILQSKDYVRGSTLRSAWGINPHAAGVSDWRADLVVQCPDYQECRDVDECTITTVELITAAYEVYRGYLTGSPVTTSSVHHLRELIDANPERIRRCTPLLTEQDGEFSVAQWRHRLLLELEQARYDARS